jgi:HEAT repeat protein
LNRTLTRLNSELADCPPAETMLVRWTCQQVLQALGDERAAPMLEPLHADVQATAALRTDAADRERLTQAIPNFRDIVAAYAGRGGQGIGP